MSSTPPIRPPKPAYTDCLLDGRQQAVSAAMRRMPPRNAASAAAAASSSAPAAPAPAAAAAASAHPRREEVDLSLDEDDAEDCRSFDVERVCEAERESAGAWACGVCTLICLDPVGLGCSSRNEKGAVECHVICRSCLERTAAVSKDPTFRILCPKDNATRTFDKDDIPPVDQTAQLIISHTKITCLNAGCTAVYSIGRDGTRDKQHRKVCPFQGIPCPNKGCKERRPRDVMYIHLVACQFNPTTCGMCGDTFGDQSTLDHHRATSSASADGGTVCPNSKPCLNACTKDGMIRIIRNELMQHHLLNECPERKEKCIFAGCNSMVRACKKEKHAEQNALMHLELVAKEQQRLSMRPIHPFREDGFQRIFQDIYRIDPTLVEPVDFTSEVHHPLVDTLELVYRTYKGGIGNIELALNFKAEDDALMEGGTFGIVAKICRPATALTACSMEGADIDHGTQLELFFERFPVQALMKRDTRPLTLFSHEVFKMQLRSEMCGSDGKAFVLVELYHLPPADAKSAELRRAEMKQLADAEKQLKHGVKRRKVEQSGQAVEAAAARHGSSSAAAAAAEASPNLWGGRVAGAQAMKKMREADRQPAASRRRRRSPSHNSDASYDLNSD